LILLLLALQGKITTSSILYTYMHARAVATPLCIHTL
jgi:hypothetical protein